MWLKESHEELYIIIIHFSTFYLLLRFDLLVQIPSILKMQKSFALSDLIIE